MRLTDENPFLQGAMAVIQQTQAGRLVLSTVRRHESVLKLHVFPFLKRLKDKEPVLFPVPEHVLLMMLAYRFQQSGTVYAAASVFDAVRWLQNAGFHQPYQDEKVFHQFINTLRKMHGKRVQHTAMPNIEWVQTMLRHCSRDGASLVEVRLGTVVAIMTATCSRKADVLRLRIGAVEFFQDRIDFYFWVTKTDQFRSGYRKSISLKEDSLRVADMLKKHMLSMGVWKMDPSDVRHGNPLFGQIQHLHNASDRFVPTTIFSKSIDPATMSKTFANIRKTLKLPSAFVMHGLRVLASSLMSLTMPIEQIKRAGGWVSDTVWEYMEPTEADRVAGSEAVSRYASKKDKPEWFTTDLQMVMDECLTDEEDYDDEKE